MAPRPLSVETAARRDLRALREYGNSGLARAYLALAREIDDGMPGRDLAAAVNSMRLVFLALQQLSPPKEGGDFTDELRARREANMTKIANGGT